MKTTKYTAKEYLEWWHAQGFTDPFSLGRLQRKYPDRVWELYSAPIRLRQAIVSARPVALP